MLGEVYSSKAQDRHKENEKQTDYNYLHTSVSLSIGMAYARERDFFSFFTKLLKRIALSFIFLLFCIYNSSSSPLLRS